MDFTGDPNVYTWHWSETWAWNMEHSIPPRALVVSGRFPIALMGAISCFAFFWLVSLVTNRYCGIVALASLLGARLLFLSCRVALIDAPVIAFSIMTLIGMIYVLRTLRSEQAAKAIVWALPTGIVAGLAVSTKLNALLILGACLCSLLLEALWWMRTDRQRTHTSLLCLAVIMSCVALIFYASNPFLYQHPFAGVQHLLELNALIASIHFDPLKTIPERVMAVWKSLEVFAPLRFLGLSGDRWVTLFGLVMLLATAWQNFQQLRSRQLDFIIIWIIITYVGITLWIPHNWSRYYLLLQPCNAFLQSYVLYWFGKQIWLERYKLGRLSHYWG